MKKALVLAMLLIFALGTGVSAVETPGTLDEAKAMAIELNKPLLVDFFTTW